MKKFKRIFAVIPARSGSKGLANKNILPLDGKPLLAWTIEAAQQSELLEEYIVSTDSASIAEIAQQYGAPVPFLRPQELATDEAQGFEVLLHALHWRESFSPPCSHVMVLQPTSPLRTAQHIDDAIKVLLERQAKAIISVSPCTHHPWWTNTLPENRSMENFLRPEIINQNRQDLPPHYRLNGALYCAELGYLKEKKSFLGSETIAYIMQPEHSVDIDTAFDLRLAELLLHDQKDKVKTENQS